MRLGYACVNMTLDRTARSLWLVTLRARGIPYLQSIVDDNLLLLADILRWNRERAICMFRLTSDLVPFGSHDEVDLATLTFSRAEEIRLLSDGMRLSMHPGQFTVVSAMGAVWENSQKELLFQSEMMDILGIDGDIVIHGGGVYGDRTATAVRIATNIARLPEPLRHRVRLENDERSWSVADLLPISEETGTPLIVDNLHHALNGGLISGGTPLAGLPWDRIGATWGGRLPKLHYSEQDPTKRPGAHSSYITASLFHLFQEDVFLPDYDVMLECKAKELALLRLREDLSCVSC